MPLSPCTRTQKKSAAPRKVVQCPLLRSIGPRCLKNWTLSVVDGSKKSSRGASCYTPLGRPRRLLCDEQIQKNAEEFAELIRRFFNDDDDDTAVSAMATAQSLAPRAATAHRKTRRWTGAQRRSSAQSHAPPLQCRATQTLPSTCGCIECIQFMHATHVSCSPPSSLERCRITSVFNEPLERHVAGVALDGPVSKWQLRELPCPFCPQYLATMPKPVCTHRPTARSLTTPPPASPAASTFPRLHTPPPPNSATVARHVQEPARRAAQEGGGGSTRGRRGLDAVSHL